MKVLLVFANSSVRQQKADPERLKEILESAGKQKSDDFEVFTTFARSLSFFISNEQTRIRDGKNHMNLEDYDFVYFRKAGAAMQQMQVCAHYLADHDVPFFDHELLRANSRNKLSQMYMMQKKGLPIPKTLFCRNNRRLLRLVTKRYAEHFNFPLIAKATGGTRGDANYKADNAEELTRILSTDKHHYLIQEFIPNDGDFRFFVAGGVLRGVIERKASGESHLNNTSQGGTAELVSPGKFSDIVRNESVYAAQMFGRDVAGVDVMFDNRNGQHYFLEVNRAPQIEGASFEAEKGKWMADAITNTVLNYQPSSRSDTFEQKMVIGRFESVHVIGQTGPEQKVIAKIDTGADSSSIHCSNIRIEDERLLCRIGDQDFVFEKYSTKQIRSTSGHSTKRYIVNLPVRIGDQQYRMRVSLSDRSSLRFEMLIGRRFLRANNFMVNVSRRFIQSGKKKESE